jgi:hypothetical protein
VGRAPVARVEARGTAALVNDRVDEKRRRDLGRDALALIVDGVAVQPSRADARAPSARLEVEGLQVRGGDCARRGEARTDTFAPAGEAREVVEVDSAGEDDVRVIDERAVDFDGRAALGRAEVDVLSLVLRVVIERADALRDEGREQLSLLGRGDGPVDAGGEDDPQISGRDAERDQPAGEEVDDLTGGRRARRVRDDDEHALAGRDDLFERLRVEGVVDERAHLRVGERLGGGRFGGRQNLETPRVVREGDVAPPVT